jgi:hypothetical protein
MHNPLNLGQSHAGTFESLLRVKTLHYAKQLAQLLHIKSYSIVFDKYERIEQLIRALGMAGLGRKALVVSHCGRLVRDKARYRASVPSPKSLGLCCVQNGPPVRPWPDGPSRTGSGRPLPKRPTPGGSVTKSKICEKSRLRTPRGDRISFRSARVVPLIDHCTHPADSG